MMQIEECLNNVLEAVKPIEEYETVPLNKLCGRISYRDVFASSPVPPFPKSAMDGYAVRAEDTVEAEKLGEVSLKVTGKLLAGEYENIEYKKNTAVRVMTGSYIPYGFDAVVKQEDTDMGEDSVTVRKRVCPGENYCTAGEDIRQGAVILEKGKVIDPVKIGMLASAGKASADVVRKPKITIISTGSELMEPGRELLPGKIYASTGYILASAAEKHGIKVCGPYLCGDCEKEAEKLINSAAETSDMVITTGALSVGERDFIPALIKNMGGEILFSGADIQPGTPTMASLVKNKVVLSLSGNPYAAVANFEVYFWDIMARMTECSDMSPEISSAYLKDDYNKVNRHRRLIRAKAENDKVYLPSQVHSSSVINNLTLCNCFIDLEPGRKVKKGDLVKIRYIKGI